MLKIRRKTNINLYIYMGEKIYMNKGRRRRFICILNIAIIFLCEVLFKFNVKKYFSI